MNQDKQICTGFFAPELLKFQSYPEGEIYHIQKSQ
jgi:hypothetical protein